MTERFDARTLEERAWDASKTLDEAIDELEVAAHQASAAEAWYRECKAKALVLHADGSNAQLREANAEGEIFTHPETHEASTLTQIRYRRDLTDKLHYAAAQALKSRQYQLSMLQSLIRKETAEADLARTAPAGYERGAA